MPSLQDLALDALRAVTPVQLIASLRDARLRCGARDRLLVAIPDLHLLSHTRRAAYPYGTNDEPVLVAALRALGALRGAHPGVELLQLGDGLDLWREAANPTSAIVDTIWADHAELRAALAPARHLIGNHDIALHRWEPWRSTYLRQLLLSLRSDTAWTGFAIHGDELDLLELLPDALSALAVRLVHPGSGAYDDGHVLPLPAHDYGHAITGPHDPGPLRALVKSVPGRHNLRSEHPLLHPALRLRDRLRDAHTVDARYAIIGHTHAASLTVHDEPGDFFVLVDAGAWIEDLVVDGRRVPNRQLATIGGNEVRIYQVG